MCTIPAAASVGLSTLGSYMGQSSTAAAYQRQMDAQAKSAIMQMNYGFQDYDKELLDDWEASLAQITKTRLNALQLNSGVKAAVYENMGDSRTGRMLIRTAEGDTARTVASEQENYQRKANTTDLKKERLLKNTRLTLENINDSAPEMPSALANGISFAASALSAYTGVQNAKAGLASKGLKMDIWGGAVSG